MSLSRKDGSRENPEALFDARKVDLVGTPADKSTVDLIIVNDSGWTGTDAQIRSLQEKIHAYVAFALDGQLTAMYPETEGQPWRIVIHDQAGPVDPRSALVIERVGERVRHYGGDLVVVVR